MEKDSKNSGIDAAFVIDQARGRDRPLVPYQTPGRKEVSTEENIADYEQPGEINKNHDTLSEKRQEAKESSRRKKAMPGYRDVFLMCNEIKHRQCVYISHNVHELITRLVRVLVEDGSEITVGGYIDKVLHQHLQTYKDDINEIYSHRRTELLE